MKRGKTLWKTLVSASAVLTLAAGAITPALADNTDTSTTTTASGSEIVPDGGFTKTYKVVSALAQTDATNPEETFTFSTGDLVDIQNSDPEYSVGKATDNIKHIFIGKNTDNTTDNVTFKKGTATSDGVTAPISIRANIKDYDRPGVYYYNFKENDGETAGVTYSADTYQVILPVVYEDSKLKFGTAYVKDITTENNPKVKTIVNEYRAGSLEVNKSVAGNLGDRNKAFTITVTLNAPKTPENVPADKDVKKVVKSDMKLLVTNAPDKNSVVVDPDTQSSSGAVYENGAYTIAGDGWTTKIITFKVKDGSNYKLVNVPAGVTYTVSEEESNGYTTTIEYPKTTDGKPNTTMDATEQVVNITNTKDKTLDTGVFLNNMPYIALVAVAAVALVFFMKNQKHQEQE